VLVDLSEPMQRSFVELHYPCYWHYDVLFGLRVLTEAGFGDDPRCQAARRDYISSRRLPDGGWAADAAFWTPAPCP